MSKFKVTLEARSKWGSAYVRTSRHAARTAREAVIAAVQASGVIEDVTTVTIRVAEDAS